MPGGSQYIEHVENSWMFHAAEGIGYTSKISVADRVPI